jgi:hypothetical protein
LLAAATQTSSVEKLRQIPASNVIFRRSRNTKSLNLSAAKAAEECVPALRSLITAVNPRAVLLISSTAYKLFKTYHCELESVEEDDRPLIVTPNGKANARIFLSARGRVCGLNRTVPLFMVGHPSKYAGRNEWPEVVEALRQGFKECGLSPIEQSAFVSLYPIHSYGTNV